MRHKPGEHLTQAGVNLARRVGADLGRFDLVITSSSPRAYETAIAMGFAVDEEIDLLNMLPEEILSQITRDEGFDRFAETTLAQPDGVAATFSRQMAGLHARIASQLPDEGRALIVSHGSIVEASAIVCVPQADYSGWGPLCDYCEGSDSFMTAAVSRTWNCFASQERKKRLKYLTP